MKKLSTFKYHCTGIDCIITSYRREWKTFVGWWNTLGSQLLGLTQRTDDHLIGQYYGQPWLANSDSDIHLLSVVVKWCRDRCDVWQAMEPWWIDVVGSPVAWGCKPCWHNLIHTPRILHTVNPAQIFLTRSPGHTLCTRMSGGTYVYTASWSGLHISMVGYHWI